MAGVAPMAVVAEMVGVVVVVVVVMARRLHDCVRALGCRLLQGCRLFPLWKACMMRQTHHDKPLTAQHRCNNGSSSHCRRRAHDM